MRVLVISDSHGDSFGVRTAVEQQPTAQLIVFLGDGEYDVSFLDNYRVPVIKVRGNCDFGSELPASVVDEVESVRIYCTHGYKESVKYTLSVLKECAVENNARIALYGHTHVPDTKYEDGIWFVNPGSIRDDSYAVVDIIKGGIMPILMKLR